MNDIEIKPDTTIFPEGRPYFWKESNETAVLLIHGYTGIPKEMNFLSQKIKEKTDYTIYIPRLPGHGTNSQDFRQSGARDWLRKTYDSYLDLKKEHKKIYVIGLSMGGLLALLTAARFEVEKLVTISAALDTRSSLVPFTPILRYFMPTIKQKGLEKKIENSKTKFEKIYHKNYHMYHYTAQIAELVKIMNLTKKQLKEVFSPALIIGSTNDELVPITAARDIKNKINSKKKEIIIYNNSPHVVCNGPEKEPCSKKIIEFLKEK